MFKVNTVWIIKLGGSLLGSPTLQQWLSHIAQYGDGKVIIVPGGGLFADAVRQAEQRVNLTAPAAHALAVMAMDQYARVLVDLEPSLVLAKNELELAERGWQHRGIVWQPSEMVLADASIPASWDVTSDSLAAWLAHKCEAKHLVMVKSSPLVSPTGNATLSVEKLVTEDVVDIAFPSFIRSAGYATWLVHESVHHAFAQGFYEASLTQHGARVS